MKSWKRTVNGEFRAVESALGPHSSAGAWRLAGDAPAGADVYLRGVDENGAQALRGTAARAVEIEWLADEVRVTLRTAQGSSVLRAREALVHEPLAHLYDALPLARLDSSARRFWRWVFRLVRLPGGRYLLGFAARRSRAPEQP